MELQHLIASLGQVVSEVESDPLSVAEAMRQPDWPKWYEAMKEEISQL